MSKAKSFPILGGDALELLSELGLRGFGTNRKEYPTHVSVSCIWLYLANGQILAVSGEMHDLEGWDEVGSIVVDKVHLTDLVPRIIELPTEWREIDSIELLAVHEEGKFTADSGIRISNSAGQEIIICNAAAPCEVTLSASFSQDKFNPEYDIGRYISRPYYSK